uniref:Uncharacterized protein n=1 Tax=Vespula pensylvanica TaxID=30213 RepID=A0A834NYT0_VESPE|nr:hypothetical protein H0235_010986 [Vespula pensylvanica]
MAERPERGSFESRKALRESSKLGPSTLSTLSFGFMALLPVFVSDFFLPKASRSYETPETEGFGILSGRLNEGIGDGDGGGLESYSND